MSFRDGPFQDLKVPLPWIAAAALVVAVMIAGALLFSGSGGYGPVQQTFDRIDRPVAGGLAAPVAWTRSGFLGIKGYFFAVSENRKLREENQRLRHTADLAVALADDNMRLRSILGMHTDPPIPMVAGRTVLDSRGAFAKTRLLNVGDEGGVEIGNPVMNERGLVGRIVGVTRGASRVLLLSDVASRTPVLIDRTDARAILTGDGSGNPRLAYMRGVNPVKEGDRVLTSGDGGVIPRGLPVGVAAKGLDGQWRVKLNADLTAVDYVQVLKFKDFTQLVKLAELERLRMPPPTAGASTPADTVHAISGSAAGPAAASPASGAAKPTAPASVALKPSSSSAKPGAGAAAAAKPSTVQAKPLASPAKRPAAPAGATAIRAGSSTSAGQGGANSAAAAHAPAAHPDHRAPAPAVVSPPSPARPPRTP